MPLDGGLTSGEEDLRFDSVGENESGESTMGIIDLHQKLIDIDEEIGSDDFELLKFLCRDLIPVARLQSAESPLEVFQYLKRQLLIDYNNVNILLELFGRIHRFDLVKHLGMDVMAVRRELPNFKTLDSYRLLLFQIAEEIEEKEAEKIRFFLRGQMSKKMLNNKQSMLQLLIFMEQEALISHGNVDVLLNVMESIRRGDLIDKIREYQGLAPLYAVGPGLSQVIKSNTTPMEPSPVELPPSDLPRRQEVTNVQNGNDTRDGHVNRSASAGTLSVSSEETPPHSVGGYIPEAVFHQIINEVKEQDMDLAIELGYSNNEIDKYVEKFKDKGQRSRWLIIDWQNKQEDRGSIPSKLLFVLTKLGCKSSAQAMKDWMDSFSIGNGLQTPVLSSEEQSENNYSSLRHAMPLSALNTQNSNQQALAQEQIIQSISQLGITAENLPHGNDVNFVNNVALYQLQGKIVANSGISQRLADIRPVTVTTGPLPNPNQAGPRVQTVNTGTSAQIIPAANDGFPMYRMDRKPRGWCVIINNETFTVDTGDPEAKEMPPRRGTERDAVNLCSTFDKLGFIVRRYDNLTHDEMMSTLVDKAHNVKHDNFDCFVCCILTHGVLNNLYGSDGKLVSIKDLTTTFQTNRCKSLAGKPKLFFFQACQGRDKMTGGHIERDGPNSGYIPSGMEFIPNEADFLLGFATVPGYVSFRSRNQGSWYIRKLCELLDKYAHKYDLMTILTELNREVGNANANLDNGIYKQCPAPFVTLRKQLYFK